MNDQKWKVVHLSFIRLKKDEKKNNQLEFQVQHTRSSLQGELTQSNDTDRYKEENRNGRPKTC
jgi:hypothetical protein